MTSDAWNPGGFPPWITLLAKLVLFGTMLIRGVDYWAGEDVTPMRLTVVEAAAPLWVWGLILIAGAFVGFISISMRWGKGVMYGHFAGSVTYLSLAVGVVADVAHKTTITGQALALPAIVLGVGCVATACTVRWSTWKFAELTAVGITTSLTLASLALHFDGLRSASILLTISTLHGLMAIGTAAHIRQRELLRGVVT